MGRPDEIAEGSFILLEWERDGLPALCAANPSLAAPRPRPDLPWQLSVVIPCLDLGENRMPSLEELNALDDLGDELDRVLEAEGNARGLARITWDATREALYRVRDPEEAGRALAALAESGILGRPFEHRTESDPDWELVEPYWPENWPGPAEWPPGPPARPWGWRWRRGPLRFTVRRLMVFAALAGLAFGLEMARRRRDDFVAREVVHARRLKLYSHIAALSANQARYLRGEPVQVPEGILLLLRDAAHQADRSGSTRSEVASRFEADSRAFAARAEYHRRMVDKYLGAIRFPFSTVEPDPPAPRTMLDRNL